MEVNNALTEGTTPPKAKREELLPRSRLAISIHIMEHIVFAKLNGEQVTNPPPEINKETLVKAMYFLELMENQK